MNRKDYNNDIISNVDNAMLFLQQHIPVRYEFDGSPQRIEISEIPLEALREAVINAVCHRYYFEKGANIMVEIFDDRVEISSPGGLVKGLQKDDFGKKSILRNPKIASLFYRIGYIEKMGTGIKRMQNLMKKWGLKPVLFEFTSFVTVIFYRPLRKDKIIKETVEETGDMILRFIKNNPYITAKEIENITRLSRRGVEWNIAKLKENGLLKRIGSTKRGHWGIIE